MWWWTHLAGSVWSILKLLCWILVCLQRRFAGSQCEHSESACRASLHFITSPWRSAEHVTSSAEADLSDCSWWTYIKGVLWSELKPASDPVTMTESEFYVWKLPVLLLRMFLHHPSIVLSCCSFTPFLAHYIRLVNVGPLKGPCNKR